MHLTGPDALSITLRPLGYQFPNVATNEWNDLNWLVIEGDVRSPDGAWTFQDPCLQTSEAVRLGAWLAEASIGIAKVREADGDGGVWPEWMFLEPNLGFSVEAYEDDVVVLRVHFSLEPAPAWAEEEQRVSTSQYFVRCRMSYEELRAASRDWLSEIAQFPERGTRRAPSGGASGL